MKRFEAIKYRHSIEGAAALQDDAVALENIDLYPTWKAGIAVAVGDRYRYGETLYKVIQAHTTQEDWTPDITPALFVVVSLDEWPEWKQPTGSQDAYNKGDKVTYKGDHYISLIDANVWSPEEYPAGWEKQG